jgi:hypothetical protein
MALNLLSKMLLFSSGLAVGGDSLVHEGMSQWTDIVIVEETQEMQTPAGFLMAAKYATEVDMSG